MIDAFVILWYKDGSFGRVQARHANEIDAAMAAFAGADGSGAAWASETESRDTYLRLTSLGGSQVGVLASVIACWTLSTAAERERDSAAAAELEAELLANRERFAPATETAPESVAT